MKPWLAFGLLFACGCGRTAHDVDDGGLASLAGAEAGGNTSPPGVGPIDATDQPDALRMTCAGRADSLAFRLPCSIGMNFAGDPNQPGYHVVECQLAGQPDKTAVSFILQLRELPKLLNQPVTLPLAGVPTPPGPQGVTLDGERFAGMLSGVVTFTQVDVDGRAFVARLEKGHVTWNGDAGDSFACSTIDGPLWAIAGYFI